MSALLEAKRKNHVGTYRVVPKVNWSGLEASHFTEEGQSEVDWLNLYPVKPIRDGDEMPLPQGTFSPRQAAKLFYDGVYILEEATKRPKSLSDRLPELGQKAVKRKQFQKQMIEACRRVCCRIAKGKEFGANCVAEDIFVIMILESTFQLGWRRIESHLEGLPECIGDRDFSKIKRICVPSEVELLWRGVDAVLNAKDAANKKGSKKDTISISNRKDITDPQNWFTGYAADTTHLLDHHISVDPAIMAEQAKTLKLLDSLVKALPTQYEVLSKEAENSTCAIVVTEARNPYLITYVNTAWSNITGFTKEDVVGKTLEMIQGPKTDVQKMKEIALAAASGKEMRVEMVNYDKDQKSFRTHLRSKQLTSSSNPNGFIMTVMYKIRDF